MILIDYVDSGDQVKLCLCRLMLTKKIALQTFANNIKWVVHATYLTIINN